MKNRKINALKGIVIGVVALLSGQQHVFAQDALTSVKINIQNLAMSQDKKTISYDVYIQDVDATNPISIPGFLFRLAVPVSELGTNLKTVSVTNATTALGVDGVAMSVSGSNWLMKFTQANLITSYNNALKISETFPGTRIGTFNISNTDGTAFANPQSFTATYAGITPQTKSTVSIFRYNTTTLAENPSEPQPEANFNGLGSHSLTVSKTPLTITGITAVSRAYNGTTAVTLNGGTLVGVASGDAVTLVAGTGAFADKNAGNGKAVTVTGYGLSGADADKYSLNQPTDIKANITKATLTVSGVTTSNKVYNANTAATLSGGSLNGVISGDVVTLVTGTGAFANKNVGTDKAITVTGYGVSGTDAGNYTVTQPSGLKASITPVSVSISGVTANDKVYNGNTTATFTGGSFTGVLPGDVVTVATGTGTFFDKNVGTDKAVTATGFGLSGLDGGNYTLIAQPSGLKANITTATLTVSGITATSRPYDGTTAATLSGGSLVGVASGDVVNLSSGTGSFATKTAGTGKTVNTTGYSISGGDAANYTLTQPTGVKANITQLTLTVSGVTASNKAYDGSKTATLSGGSLNGVLSGDAVTLVTGTGTFANKNVGTDKTITASGYGVSGADAANYTVTQPTGLKADVTPISVSITGVTANDKTYDGTNTATLSGGSLTGVFPGDLVTLVPGTGTFTDKNAGNNKPVTVTGYGLGGADAGNYTLSGQPTGLTANILAPSSGILTITGITASNKTYDGTTHATLTGGTLVGVAPGDEVSLEIGTGSFATKNAGNGKAVSVSGYRITGADAGKYTLTQPTGLTADILHAPLNITGIGASNKVYDGNTKAYLSGGVLVGVISGDIVSISSANGTFTDKNVENGKTIIISGQTLQGPDAANYILNEPTDVKANISPLPISITGLTVVDKPYDGKTNSTLKDGVLNGILAGDTVTLSSGFGFFSDKNAGSNKTVNVFGYTLTGPNAGNYLLIQPSGLVGTITRKKLSVNDMKANNKVYDGTTSATLTGGTLTGVINGDDVILKCGSGNFSNKNAGLGKTVTVTGFSMGGADSSNYELNTLMSGLTADITPVQLNIVGMTAYDRVYDGTVNARLSIGTLVGLLPGDVVSVTAGKGVFADKNAGTDKPVIISGYSISGINAPNYTIIQPTDVTATIDPAPLTLEGFSAYDKVYDGTTQATLSNCTLSGVKKGDEVGIAMGTGTFADKNTGENKPVILSGFSLTGTDASNYTMVEPDVSASISKAPLNVTNLGVTSKIYDGTTFAKLTGGTLSGVMSGDDVKLVTGIGTYADKHVGKEKKVTVTGCTISGADSLNYTFNASTDQLKADITPAPVTIEGIEALSKPYDGKTSVIVSGGTLVGCFQGDNVKVVTGNAAFSDKNAGTGKQVVFSGYSLTGTGAKNYQLVQPTGITATIAPLPIHLTGVKADSKEYDGTATTTLSGGKITGILSGDVCSLVLGKGQFADKNIGICKAVEVVGCKLTGPNEMNYTLTQPSGLTADITAAQLNISEPMIRLRKLYDGTTTADVSPGILSGVVNEDLDFITVKAEANFDNASIGKNKTITVLYQLFGAEATNYKAPFPTIYRMGEITENADDTASVIPLTVIDTRITLSKTYDGTTSVTFTPGSLVGVQAQDKGNVVLHVSVSYDNANAGVGKTIKVNYSLTGTAANKYSIVSEQIYDGAEIKQKQLTVSGIKVVKTKPEDGNTEATISSMGKLRGIIPADTENVLLKANANFNDPTVGKGKTISLTYLLEGQAKNNYLIPADSIITNAAITEKIKVDRVAVTHEDINKPTIGVTYDVISGSPALYEIAFDSAAICAGMQNTGLNDLLPTGNDTIKFKVPDGVKDGHYNGVLVIKDSYGTDSVYHPFDFTVLVSSSYIVKVFDDVITCNNVEDEFIGYQWYKNGEPILGATKQFYQEIGGLDGSYYLELTKKDGTKTLSYPKTFTKTVQPAARKTSVYPNPVKSNQAFIIELDGLSDEELSKSVLSLYSLNGVCVFQTNNLEKKNTIQVSLPTQEYIGHVRTESGSDLSFKVKVVN